MPTAINSHLHSTVIDDEPTKHRLIDDSGTSATVLYSAEKILQVLQGLVGWLPSVISQINNPPGSPTTGDRYLIHTAPTGVWASYADHVAEATASGWEYTVPVEGYATYNKDTNLFMMYNSTAWVDFGMSFDHGNLLGLTDEDHPASAIFTIVSSFAGLLSAADDTVQKALDTLDDHTHDSRYYTETEMDIALSGKSSTTHNHDASLAWYDAGNSGTTPALDWSNGQNQKMTINDDAVFSAFSNVTDGVPMKLWCVNSGAGNATPDFSSIASTVIEVDSVSFNDADGAINLYGFLQNGSTIVVFKSAEI